MKIIAKPRIPVTAATHAGMCGKSNEDAFGFRTFARKDHTHILVGVLADGIGGHRAGEVASAMAIHHVLDFLSEMEGGDPVTLSRSALSHASEMILKQGKKNLFQAGMGATCALVWLEESKLFTASVGDSRIYHFHGDALVQLSTDHTWVQDAIEHGLLDAASGRDHPHAHIIRRYLGSDPASEVDCRMRLPSEPGSQPCESNQGITLEHGDIVLICSDGLTDMVTDAEIRATLLKNQPRAAVNKLISLANEHGGVDNTTILLVKVP